MVILCILVMAKCNPTDDNPIFHVELLKQAIIKVPVEEGEKRNGPRHRGEGKDKK